MCHLNPCYHLHCIECKDKTALFVNSNGLSHIAGVVVHLERIPVAMEQFIFYRLPANLLSLSFSVPTAKSIYMCINVI